MSGAAGRGARTEAIHCLDVLCPMHAIVDATGHIVHAGPTLEKLGARAGAAVTGERFLELFELRRPKPVDSMHGLCALAGVKLHLALRRPPRTEVKGILVPVDDCAGVAPPGGAVINLSFGISIVEAVRDFGLTGTDFAATDLAVEMLFLVEAKAAVTEELRRLNRRLEEARSAAEQQALTDTLTGLWNRRAMEPVLARLSAEKRGAALMQIDLDGFKAVNDTFGHAAGDHLLREVAARLTAATRQCDTVTRTGGDEFVLILPGVTDPGQVSRLAGRLVAEIERPLHFDGGTLAVSASIGISIAPPGAAFDPERMVQEADTALYAVKNAGRRGHLIYTPDLGRIGASPARAARR